MERKIYEEGAPCSKCQQRYNTLKCKDNLCVGGEEGNYNGLWKEPTEFLIYFTFNQLMITFGDSFVFALTDSKYCFFRLEKSGGGNRNLS